MAALDIKTNKDGTITVKFGRMVEHIDAREKTKSELFDAIKWAAISKGVYISDAMLTEILYKER